MKLKIRYRSDNDEITGRIISDIGLDPPYRIYTFCHLRNEGRSVGCAEQSEAHHSRQMRLLTPAHPTYFLVIALERAE